MEYTLTNLTPQDMQTIGQGLLELPGKFGNPVLFKIEAQLKKQQEPPNTNTEEKTG